MPTYEYECGNCGHRFDKFQSMSEDPLKICPKCGQPVRRLIGTGAGIVFKGAGFHANDYRRSSAASARPSCGRERPCCGRGAPCETKPCAQSE